MRHVVIAPLVWPGLELGDVVGEGLTVVFIAIDDAHSLRADLKEPDRGAVTNPEIPRRMHRNSRVIGDFANPTGTLGVRNFLAEVGAEDRRIE